MLLFFVRFVSFLHNQSCQTALLESRVNHKGLEMGIICDQKKLSLRYNLSVCVVPLMKPKVPP